MLLVSVAHCKVRCVNQEPLRDGRIVMTLPLVDVLEHPSMARAEPVLRTGHRHTRRVVRWVHSSEVLDIAGLLRGGELLLTGGHLLASASPDRQRSYVRNLTAHGITAVAVESTAEGELPAPLVDEAQRREFALVQLRHTVPFVEITESINGLLISDSVRQLRLADQLSDALSTELTCGAELQQLTDALAGATSAGVVVRDKGGDVLADTASPVPNADRWQAPITVHGATAAVLELLAAPDADPALMQAALDRAPQTLALALLRTRPPTAGASAARALFRTLRDNTVTEGDVASLLNTAGLDSTAPLIAVAAGPAEVSFYGALEQGILRGGRHVLSQSGDDFLAVANLAPDSADSARRALVDDMRRVGGLQPECPPVAVGPLVHGAAQLMHTVAEAQRCLDVDFREAGVHGVVDAEACSLHRLVHRLDADDALRAFVTDQLGPILEQSAQDRHRMLTTLQAFFDCAANKSDTAQRLHVRRQTLYQRLDTLARLLGHDVTDPERVADLQIAIRLLQVMDGLGPGR